MKGSGFFDHPWPSDERGRSPDLDGFPGTRDYPILDRYAEAAAALDGWGTNPTIYVRFDGSIDTELLPPPERSRARDAAVQLVDIDPDSPDRGARIPYTWDWQAEENDWRPARLLAVQPLWGFPLRSSTTYALIATTALAQPADGMKDRWSDDHPQHALYRPLQRILPDLGLTEDEIAFAVVFTTQDAVGEMARIAETIRTDLPLAALDQRLESWGGNRWFSGYDGRMRVPLWQHGERPYGTEGGGFRFTAEGEPVLAAWEEVTFTLTLPVQSDQPEGGWPVVINSHGTGGDSHDHAGVDRLSPASVQAREGMALFAISQPLHGDRGTGADPTFFTFNFFNPESARSTQRQGALDQVFLAELLTARQHCFTLDDGSEACLDPNRVAFLGHSQGGIAGAMALPYCGDRLRSAVLSGAGGGLSITLLSRDTTEVDVDALLAAELDIGLDDLDLYHPLVTLVQMLAEVTDPLNHARYWFADEPPWNGGPNDVLMTEGTEDQYTPPAAIEALAGAARLPILEPVSTSSTIALMLDLVGQAVPTSGNLEAWTGEPVSSGLAQFPGEDHFPIFNNPDAAALYQVFLASGMDGEPPEITEF